MAKYKYLLSLCFVFFLGTLPIQAAKYKALKKVKNGVTLTGQIVYDGTAPAPRDQKRRSQYCRYQEREKVGNSQKI